MSKIGQKQIIIPAGVDVRQEGKKIFLKGSSGEISIELPISLTLIKEEAGMTLKRTNENKKTRSLHGLYRQLIDNAVQGVNKPWEKRLEIVGTGYNVKIQGEDLLFKVGYSHPVVFKKQSGVKYRVEGNSKVIVEGADKQLVGQVAYQIKLIKKPDAYKGKGIKYENERLKIKPGKKAKAAGGTGAA